MARDQTTMAMLPSTLLLAITANKPFLVTAQPIRAWPVVLLERGIETSAGLSTRATMQEDGKNDDGIIVVAIAGVAIAAGALLLILAFFIFWLWKRRNPPKVPPRSSLRPPPVPPRSPHRHNHHRKEKRHHTASMTVHRASAIPPATAPSHTSSSSSKGTQTSMRVARHSKPIIERLSWVKKASITVSSPLQRAASTASSSSSSSVGKMRRASHRHAFISRHSGPFAELPGCSVERPRVPPRATIRGFSLRVPPPLPQLPSSPASALVGQVMAPSRPSSPRLTLLNTAGGTETVPHPHSSRHLSRDQTSPRSFPRTPRPDSTWSVNSCCVDRFPVSPETPSRGGIVGGGEVAGGRLQHREGGVIGQRKGSTAWTIQENTEWQTPPVMM
jgi:hypothetical protein